MNNLKITFLLILMTLILVGIGSLFGGRGGMVIAFALAVVMNFVSYWFSDKIVLKLYRARPADESKDRKLLNLVRLTAQKGFLPEPKVYIIPNQAPNAFATGRNKDHAAVAVTQGLLDTLSNDELEGVIGHELAHIKNRDILISTIVATIAGTIGILASMARWGALLGGYGGGSNNRSGGSPIALLVMAIVAPLAAMVIQMAISRTREYKADRVGAEITGRPLSLASALDKLHTAPRQMRLDERPATAHMFIANPLSGKGLSKMFSTHPPVKERIKRLEDMAAMPLV